MQFIKNIFSSSNQRYLNKAGKILKKINSLEAIYENLSEAELANIKDKIIEMSQNRKVDGIITYKACLNFVSATK